MSYSVRNYGTPFSETATHATAAVATHAASATLTYYVTDVSTSSDLAGSILLVKQGTTTIFQIQVGAANFTKQFDPPLKGVKGVLVSSEITGTAACKANIGGYEL